MKFLLVAVALACVAALANGHMLQASQSLEVHDQALFKECLALHAKGVGFFDEIASRFGYLTDAMKKDLADKRAKAAAAEKAREEAKELAKKIAAEKDAAAKKKAEEAAAAAAAAAAERRKTVGLDFLKSLNEQSHFTHFYRGADSTEPQKDYSLLLRRCQPFTIQLPRAKYDLDKDTFGFSIALAKPSKVNTGSTDLTVVASNKDLNQVTLTHDSKGTCFDAPIGRFLLSITPASTKKAVSFENALVTFLFNPINNKDDAFVPEAMTTEFDPDRIEHIFNENGFVFTFGSNGPSPVPYAYNQLSLHQLNAILDLLESRLSLKQLADVVLVVRQTTSEINSKILFGAWDGTKEKYEKKFQQVKQPNDKPWKFPGDWTNVADIIARHKENNGMVHFGQCWVFASVLTTLARSMGIATRSMSNGPSAHEVRNPKTKKFDRVCNIYWNKDGTEDRGNPKSTVKMWNFHVWNDLYMKRRDLKGGDGWQAADATYQEPSTGPNEAPFDVQGTWAGPASLALMYAGNYDSNYDASFIGSEANCVVTNYNQNDKGEWVASEPDKKWVGSQMWTAGSWKACGSAKSRMGFPARSKHGLDTRMCFLNVGQQYNKEGTFLELGTSSASAVSDDKASARVGDDFTIDISYDLLTKAGVTALNFPLSYKFAIQAVTQERAEPLGAILATAEGSVKAKTETMSKAFGADFWKLPAVTAALKETRTVRVSRMVTDAKGKVIFQRPDTFSFDGNVLKLDCGKGPFALNTFLTCTVTLDDVSKSFPALENARFGLEVSSQLIELDKVPRAGPIAFKSGDKVELKHFLNQPVTTAQAIVTLNADNLRGLRGFFQIDVVSDPKAPAAVIPKEVHQERHKFKAFLETAQAKIHVLKKKVL